MSRAKSKGNRTSLAKTPIGIQGLDEVTGGVCCFIWLSYGGEGEIRTPDSLTTMPDEESGPAPTIPLYDDQALAGTAPEVVPAPVPPFHFFGLFFFFG